jgi:hypothetical protein
MTFFGIYPAYELLLGLRIVLRRQFRYLHAGFMNRAGIFQQAVNTRMIVINTTGHLAVRIR